ncbi:carbohydrate binding domain-containing protein [Paenibacillus chitinolyticus]|nr:carbohydrate binding domain-containing protein [Paenibacillus chitinolyticus]MCY9593908.1 carbohydrate binding domain-containing protein [Paenibacillus chitinolyticus]MCY9599888.1 carbohydrate binding domain-containing protein [Paenibacillus chitinolyticus]
MKIFASTLLVVFGLLVSNLSVFAVSYQYSDNGQLEYMQLDSDLAREYSYDKNGNLLQAKEHQTVYPGSLVRNGSFEDGKDEGGWTSWPGDSTVLLDNDSLRGDKSIKIVNKNKSYSNWGQTITGFIPGQTYLMEGWVKTDNVTALPNHGAFLYVSFKNAENNELAYKWIDPITGTNPWKRLGAAITVPEGTASIYISAMLYGASGTAWFDEIKINEVNPNLIFNGGFEKESGRDDNHWGSWSPETSNIKADNAGHTGANSLLLQNKDMAYTNWGQTIKDIKKGRYYLFEGWVKTENVDAPENYGAFLYYSIRDAAGKEVSNEWIQPQTGTRDWTRLSRIIKIPREAKEIYISTMLYGASGKAWFDDMKLIEMNDKGDLIQNGSFEWEYGIKEGGWWSWSTTDNISQSDLARDGKKSVKLQNPGQAYTNWGQTITDFKVGEKYTLEGWVKVENVQAPPLYGAFLYYNFKDANGKEIANEWVEPQVGSKDWTKISKDVIVPAGTKEIFVSTMLYGASGTAWFDSIKFYPASSR